MSVSLMSGRFVYVQRHHHGWFAYYRFHRAREIWFGRRWVALTW